MVAVDAKDGRVVTDGWVTRDRRLAARELAGRCADAGIARLLVTSTRRDGSLAGPDLELLTDVLEAGLPVLAAGGIATLDDLAHAPRPRLRGRRRRERAVERPLQPRRSARRLARRRLLALGDCAPPVPSCSSSIVGHVRLRRDVPELARLLRPRRASSAGRRSEPV